MTPDDDGTARRPDPTDPARTRYAPSLPAEPADDGRTRYDRNSPPADSGKTNYGHPAVQDPHGTNYRDPTVGDTPDTRYVPTHGGGDTDAQDQLRKGAKAALPRPFGNYELLQKVARGGMGVVYRARQLRTGRVVALKMVLRGEFATPADVERFRTETRAAAALDHPAIVPIYDVAEAEGLPYYTMAFVGGGSLQEALGRGPLPPREAADLVRVVAEAVQYAHDRGVLHRDIKPHNILLQREGGGESEDSSSEAAGAGLTPAHRPAAPRLTDFGLARFRDDTRGLTATGEAIGTPSYMPPEQAAGDRARVGVAADVYSLGAVLYATLTGRPPFQSGSELETLRQVLHEEPLPPRRLNPAVPGDLDTVCMKCLEKRPERRYPSALDLARDLDRYLCGEPVRARPMGRVERGWRVARRRKALLATLAAGLCGVVGLLLWGNAEAHRRSQAKDDAAKQQALLDQNRTDKVQAARNSADAARAALRRDQFEESTRLFARAAGLLADDAELAPQHRESLERLTKSQALSGFYRGLDQMELASAFKQFTVATTACEESLRWLRLGDHAEWWAALPVDDLTPEQANRFRHDVYRQLLVLSIVRVKNHLEQYGLANLPAAVAEGEKTGELAVRWKRTFASNYLEYFAYRTDGKGGPAVDLTGIPAKEHLDYYLSGIVHLWLSNPDAGFASRIGVQLIRSLRVTGVDLESPARRAENDLRMATYLEPTHYWSHFWLAEALMRRKEYDMADLALGSCVILRPTVPAAYWLRSEIADLRARDRTAARPYASFFAERSAKDRALAIELSRTDPMLLAELGTLSSEKGEFQSAVTAFRAVLALQPNLPRGWVGLARALNGLKDYEQALAAGKRAGELDPGLPDAANHVGANLLWLGRYEEAVAAYRRAMEMQPDAAPPLCGLGHALVGLQRFEEAKAAYERALALDSRNAIARSGLAVAYRSLGRADAAFAEARRSLELSPRMSEPQHQLGLLYQSLGDYPKATQALNDAIANSPETAVYHLHLGQLQLEVGNLAAARTCCDAAARLPPGLPANHLWLGEFLLAQGRVAEATAFLSKCHERLPASDPLNNSLDRADRACRRRAELDADLDRFLQANSQPRAAGAALEMATVCCLPSHRLYAAATRLFDEAFTADPALAERRPGRNRLTAAGAAVLAAREEGRDAHPLPDKARRGQRRLALQWLTAEAAARARQIQSGETAAVADARRALGLMRAKAELEGVRSAAELKALDDDERRDWTDLWAEADALWNSLPPSGERPPKGQARGR